MDLNNIDIVRQELQMITNVMTNDLDYLVALLLKGGTKDTYIQEKNPVYSPQKVTDVEVDVDNWFNSLEEVQL